MQGQGVNRLAAGGVRFARPLPLHHPLAVRRYWRRGPAFSPR
eukprot:COSAG04_NODE_27566_length_281_cov_2.252747_1_plen_41_part_01